MPSRNRLQPVVAGALLIATTACTGSAQTNNPTTDQRPSSSSATQREMEVHVTGDAYIFEAWLKDVSAHYRPDTGPSVKTGPECDGHTLNNPVNKYQRDRLRALTEGETIKRSVDENNPEMLDRIVAHVCSPSRTLTIVLTAQGRYELIGDTSQAIRGPGGTERQPWGEDVQQTNGHNLLQGRVIGGIGTTRIENGQEKLAGIFAIGGDGGQFQFPNDMAPIGTDVLSKVAPLGDVTAMVVGVDKKAAVLIVNNNNGWHQHSSIGEIRPSASQMFIPVYPPGDRAAKQEADDIMAALKGLEAGLDNATKPAIVLTPVL